MKLKRALVDKGLRMGSAFYRNSDLKSDKMIFY